ncbi:ER membrane protein complex subunit 10 isoform X2 [Anabrus simplex]|uniref:ER membrane protein complex subunit 10 isoform X2 n=1 Tax=Anabrus simplex TaxID=316456 RepID=UPI0035A33DFD
MLECISRILFLAYICIVSVSSFQADVDYDGLITVKLQHALDPIPSTDFSDRGLVNVQSIRTGSVALQQASLSTDDRQRLMLAAEDGLYRLRSFVRTSDGKEQSFLTFVKACSLVESQLSDILTVSLDHTGSVIAVSMTTSPAVCEGRYVSKDDLRYFNTTVFVKHMEVGPVPDTAAYIQKLEREKEARERGETKDNRSFLAKYVSYLVAFFWKLLDFLIYVIICVFFFIVQGMIFGFRSL